MGKDPKRDRLPAMALAGVGMELGATVALLALGGWWLDTKLGTSPWLMLGGALIGLVGSLYNIWRVGRRYFKN